VIEGGVKHWPASQTWNHAHLTSALGDRVITLRHSRTRFHPDLFSGSLSEQRDTRIGEFLDLLYAGRAREAGVVLAGDLNMLLSGYDDVDPGLAPLADDIEVPPLFDPDRLRSIGIWMSPAGVIAPIHYDRDGSHNLNAQVKGEKRVIMISPRHLLAPFSAGTPALRQADVTHFSRVNIEEIEASDLPAFRAATYVETILEEGDMLFIPSYWWHGVYHRGEINMNVTFWWAPDQLELTRTSLRQQLVDLVLGAARGDDTSEIDRILGEVEESIGRMQLP
jgi:lysine-specific demethylase 8